MLTIEELKQKIAEQVPEVDFIDILGLTTEELVEAFTDKIIDNYDKFRDMLASSISRNLPLGILYRFGLALSCSRVTP